MTNKQKVIAVVTGLDLILLVAFSYLAISQSAFWAIADALVIVGFFINPRWSKSSGWRFKHDQ